MVYVTGPTPCCRTDHIEEVNVGIVMFGVLGDVHNTNPPSSISQYEFVITP